MGWVINDVARGGGRRPLVAITGRHGRFARAFRRLAEHHDLPLAVLGRPELDLSRPETIEPAIRAIAPAVIVSAAGLSDPAQAETRDRDAHAVNGLAPGFIGEAAAACGCPVIHLSSDAVYGEATGLVDESRPARPDSIFALSKHEGERNLADSGARSVILRMSRLYARDEADGLVRRLLTAAPDERVESRGRMLVQPVSVREAAMAVWVIAGRLLADGGDGLRPVYHLAGPEAVRLDGFERMVLDLRRGMTGLAPDLDDNDAPVPPDELAAGQGAEGFTLDCSAMRQDFNIRLPPWQVRLAAELRALYPAPLP